MNLKHKYQVAQVHARAIIIIIINLYAFVINISKYWFFLQNIIFNNQKGVYILQKKTTTFSINVNCNHFYEVMFPLI